MKRIVSLLLATLMLLAFAAGCSSELADTNTTTPSATTDEPADTTPNAPAVAVTEGAAAKDITSLNTEYFPLDETATISWWFPWESTRHNNDITKVKIHEWMEEITNVQIDWEIVSQTDAATKFNLMLVSGEPTDLVNGYPSYYTSTLTYAVEEELIVDMKDYIPQYMPNYWNLLNSNQTAMKQATTDEGMMPLLYQLKTDWGVLASEPIWVGLMYREDLAKEFGFDELVTIQDWHDYLTACTTNVDTVDSALSQTTDVWDMNANFLTAYGTYPGFYVRDGKVRFGPSDESYRDAVQLMVDWYNESLLDKDFGNNVWFGNIDKFTSGQTVACCALWQVSGTYYKDSGTVDFENWNLKAAASPVLNEGATPVANYNGRAITNLSTAISVEAIDRIELIARWYDQMYSFDYMVRQFMGVENETYIIKEDGSYDYVDGFGTSEDSKIVMADYSMSNDAMGLYDFRHFDWLHADHNYHDAVYIWDTASTDEILPAGMSLTAEEGEEYSSIYNDLQTYVQENLGQFVMGAKSMDEYDAYIQTMTEGFDIERCIELQQAAYDRYMSR